MIIAPVNPLGYDELAALAAVASSSGRVPQMEVDRSNENYHEETTRKTESSETRGTSRLTSSLQTIHTRTVTYLGQESAAGKSEEILNKPCESPSHAKGKTNEIYDGDSPCDETGDSGEGETTVSNSDLTESYSDSFTAHPVKTSVEFGSGIPETVGYITKTDEKSPGHNGGITMTSDYTQETVINSKSRTEYYSSRTLNTGGVNVEKEARSLSHMEYKAANKSGRSLQEAKDYLQEAKDYLEKAKTFQTSQTLRQPNNHE